MYVRASESAVMPACRRKSRCRVAIFPSHMISSNDAKVATVSEVWPQIFNSRAFVYESLIRSIEKVDSWGYLRLRLWDVREVSPAQKNHLRTRVTTGKASRL